MSSEIETNVDNILSAAGVSYTASYHGVTISAWGSGASADSWLCTFSKGAARADFDYTTGLGLRAPATAQQKETARWRFPGLTQNDIARRTLYGRRYLEHVENLRRPKPPAAAGVLACLLQDAQSADQSFGDWCADYGYDEDSRKALETYMACQQPGRKLSGVLGAPTRAALADALADY